MVNDVSINKKIPDMNLPMTDGGSQNLVELRGRTIIYVYPRTSPPNAAPIEGWDRIPGARGCTPQSCGFRDHHAALLTAGAARVFGMSTQETSYQSEVVKRLHLPFPLLSDAQLKFSTALGLERFEAGGMTLLTRITLVLFDGLVEHIFFPINDPERNALDVIAYLKQTQ